MTLEKLNLQITTPEDDSNTDPEFIRLQGELMALKQPLLDAIANKDLPKAEELHKQALEAKAKLEAYKESLKKMQNDPEFTPDLTKFQPEQIAKGINEITDKTIIYIGEWNIHVYNKIKQFPNIKYLYESYPDKKIFTFELTTDPTIQTPGQAKQKLESKGIWIPDYGKYLLDRTEFSKEQKQYKLVQFTVKQLGLSQGATTDQIYTKAQELGLQLCSAEVGPQLRLLYEGRDWKLIAMKQITDRYGCPVVFSLASDDATFKLSGYDANLDNGWSSGIQFVFLAS